MQQTTLKTSLISALFLLILCCAENLFAADFIAEKNSNENTHKNLKIIVKGNERIDDETIISYIDLVGLKKIFGENFTKNNNQNSPEKVSNILQNSLKKLHESDLFLEAKIYQQDNQIVVEVKESPIISDIKFVGNKKIEDTALQSELTLKKRTIFTKSKLQNDLKRLNEIYIKSGRFLTKIEPKLVQKDQNRVELVFEINEGPKAKIGEIYFVGNEAFSDRELADELATKKSKWWKFLASSDSYDSDRIDHDKELLRQFYGNNGYADFATISSIAQINQRKDKFFVTFLLEEGIRYNIGEINIINLIEKFDSSILKKEILVKTGKLYNSDLIEKTVDRMMEIMSEKSYAFAHIEPVLKRNREQKTIDLDFIIEETPRVYINQIRITGNTRTLDEVIRRELRFREGDPYNINKINRSKQRIENLGYFEKVSFNTKRLNLSDKIDLEIEVKEKKTGEISLGVGYSTVDQITANVGIRENNLLGSGQQLSFNIQKSFARLNSEVSYTKPYFLGRPIDVGFDVFKSNLTKRNSMIYDQSLEGFTLRSSYSMTEFLSHQIHYSYTAQNISNVSSDASFSIRNLQGNFITSNVGHELFYDKRDSKIDPKQGYLISASQDYNGLGGNIRTIKHEGSGAYYTPTFNRDFILKFIARGGVIKGIGQGVRSNNAFFLGGNNFRGFEYAGLGPRTKDAFGSAVGGSVMGGNIYYVATAEFRFPLGLPRELGIYGILFSDNGVVKGVDPISRAGSDIANSGLIRSSYGLSIAWSSPMGPIRLDFSRVARKEIYDRTQNFRFSFGTNF